MSKHTIRKIDGTKMDIEVADLVTWGQLQHITKGILTMDAIKGTMDVDLNQLILRAIPILATPKLNPEKVSGQDVFKLGIEVILPRIFPETEIKNIAAGERNDTVGIKNS